MTGHDRYPGFHEFVAARSVALVRTAYLLTGNQHAAEDLVQEALSRVVVRWRASVAKGDPEPYVRRVLYTTHVSRWRHVRSHPVDQPPRAALDEADDTTSRIVLGQALDRLTPKQRAVLVLRYYEDLTERQTAAVLGVSVSTVKSQTSQALLRMRTVGGTSLGTTKPTRTSSFATSRRGSSSALTWRRASTGVVDWRRTSRCRCPGRRTAPTSRSTGT